MATSFNVNKADLEFILKQIKIAEETSKAYTSAPKTILQAIMDATGSSAAVASQLPWGLRTVDGTYNSLIDGQTRNGSADTLFPRLTDPVFRDDADGDTMPLGPGAPVITNTNYGNSGSVADADPRIISNLIVDMSVSNPAAIETFLNNPLAVAAFEEEHGFAPTEAWLTDPVNLVDANRALQTIPNQSPDIGLSPGFNAWMTFFGQFFDHGLDLVTKGNNGTVYIPLQADDPLYDFGVDGVVSADDGSGADGLFGTADDSMNFMALTRATKTMVNGVAQHENTTTSFVDQNQTYTSHSSHQAFLREYVTVAGKTVTTGRFLDGSAATGSVAGAVANWAEIKAQALQYLGIKLTDFDVHNVPLLLTDQYGKFIPGPNGYAQIVMAPDGTHPTNWLKEGNPDGSVTTAGSIGTNHAFLNDIAHHAAPAVVDHDHNPMTPAVAQTADTDLDVDGDGVYDPADGDILTDVNNDGVIDGKDFVADDHNGLTYDNELLNRHFVTGDGRGNENAALTVVHSIFHSEHNRLVDANKITVLQSGDLAFINEWLLTDIASLASIPADPAALAAYAATLNWDGERLFQAARFATEMQYQHLVFEEFARRIQPMVDPFIFNNSPNVDASIVAEFAHTVYRFGHSMLTGTVDRLDANLDLVNGEPDQQTLLAMFLNPTAYIESGETLEEINANFIRGLSRDVGNSIDEFIVTNVRSQLLGLPLDLGAINIARGRDTGVPTLQQTRSQLYDDTGIADLKPYESWYDFALNLKNPASVVNFIAAYGTHATILSATTVAGKRAAAEALVFGSPADNDRNDFLHGTGSYASNLGGLNEVDLWIGGLAEASPEFGGMLGTTFNYVFEFQMEALQNGDRLYYLTRTQGMNFLNQLEPNSFADMVMRNTDLGDIYSTHLNGQIFVTPDHIIELDRGIAQEDYNGAEAGNDPLWDGSNPTLEALQGPRVVRDYTNSTVVDGNHDYGGYLRVVGGEHYVLGGTEGNDRIYGDRGIDTLWGDGGDDYLNGMTESDDVFGGEGDDVIEDPFGDDVLRGMQGNDVISSARGADLMFGGAGQDYIIVGQDAAEVFGGTETDFIIGGNGKDFLLGNEGDDWIEGGGGFDTLAGDNSELFFNSSLIGHDVMFGHGDETDYDAESGDDIMGSGPSVFRYEGMFGFDWGIAKYDISGVQFDLQIPIFTTIPNDVLRDRFDQVEALSGWVFGDQLDGDDRGHSGGSSSPDSTPVELFTDHVLDQAGIDRIAGLQQLLGDGTRLNLATPNATDVHAKITSFKNGNILLGGDGNDFLRGRGGFDTLDGDAWLNVRIKIVKNGVTYSAESMSTDTAFSGPHAGKVFNVYTAADQLADPTHIAGAPNFDSPAFGGRSLNSLLLDRTINPGDMSIVREILYDNTSVNGADKNVDTAIFQGTNLEYEIEGTEVQYGADGVATNRTGVIRDVDGDGFIRVKDLDDGTVAAPGRPGGLVVSRGALTDDTDLLKNIERLQFSDATLVVPDGDSIPDNQLATGTVTIIDPSLFDVDGNPATPGVVTPIVGQVLTAKLESFVDVDGIPIDAATGLPVGLTFEWQTTEAGNDGGWATISTGLTYTVRPVDPAHVLRAVAVFKDSKGVTERIASPSTDNVTAPFSVNENSPNGTVVAESIPFSLDYDPLGLGGTGVTDGDVVQLTHLMSPGNDAGGRFDIVGGKLVVKNGGPVTLNYEAGVHTAENQSHQFVDNQYQIVIDTYTDTIDNGGLLIASRQFTIFLNDLNEGTVVDVVPTVDLHTDMTVTTPTPFAQAYRDQFDTVAYNNDNGTSDWTASWTETGDNGSAGSGDIIISTGQLRFTQTSDNNDAITRAVNGLPADVASATLSFTYQSVGLDNGILGFGDRERIIVEVRNTVSGAWTQVGDLGGNASGTFSEAIPASLLGANTQIRFRVDTSAILGGNSTFEAGESFSIDNVNVAITRNIVTTIPGTPGNNYTATYTEDGPPVAIASNPAITNDHTTILSATIKLTNAQATDLLTIAGALPLGITMSFGPSVAGEITMHLTGNASLAAYQAAIQAVRFSNSGGNPNPQTTSTPRNIQVTVNDGVSSSVIAIATVNVAASNDVPVAGDDRIVTNTTAAFTIPEWALLANDIDPDGTVDVTNIISTSGMSASLVPAGLSLQDTGGAGGSFTYEASDGVALDTANVTLVRDTAGAIDGNAGNDILVGDGANSTFNGNGGNDIIFANGGNDTLNGGAGADTMIGGLGNDVYSVDDAGDVVTEAAGQGTDRVESSVSYTLGAEVENLDLTGGAAINGTGNGVANTINGNGAANQLFGAGGNDTINGGGDADLIDGGTGNDILNGGAGNDTVIGGDGNDTIDVGSGNDTVRYAAAGFGNDSVNNFDAAGGAGNQDLIDVSALGLTSAMIGTTASSRIQVENIVEAGTDDTRITLRDASGATLGTIYLEDVQNAIDATDFVFSGTPPLGGATNGADTLPGTAGNDTMIGLQGNDIINALAGDDIIVWNANAADPADGMDIVNGGAEGVGGDTFVLNGRASLAETFRIYTVAAWVAAGNSAASLAAGTEIVITRNGTNLASVIAQLSEIEEIRVNGFDPAASGTLAGDNIQIIGDFSGTSLRQNTITIEGQSGNDTVDISGLTSAHRIVFRSNGGHDTIIGQLRPQDVLELAEDQSFEGYTSATTNGVTTLSNGTHSISYTASSVSDDDEDDDDDDNNGSDDDGEAPASQPLPFVVYIGTAFSDTAVGGMLGDALTGNQGNDTLFGLDGDDSLAGGDGNDKLFGGNGKDVISADDGNDTVLGGAGDDFVLAGAGDDAVFGEDGNDSIFGDEGRDVINGGAGSDTIFASIGDGDDVVNGGDGVDTIDYQAVFSALTVNLATGTAISAQSGNDTLSGVENVKGGGGADTIHASAAVNVFDGGAGNDTFVFGSAAAADGDTIEGFAAGDTIDLRPIFGELVDSEVLFSGAAFTASGQIRLTVSGNDTVVEGNVDNDLTDVDFAIRVAGRTNLTGNDFA